MRDVVLVPMSEEQFQSYLERAVHRYALENIKAGYRTEEDAESKSKEDHLRLLHNGLDTPFNHLFVIKDLASGIQVGALWVKFEEDGSRSGFIYDLFIEEEHRGRGLGKATIRALEKLARERAVRVLYLHVFAHNPVAIRLYQGSGFVVKSMNMERLLE
jgi:ribosomal protein S18 acetylase RimI-like enzyme